MKSKSIQRMCVFAKLAALLLTVAVSSTSLWKLRWSHGPHAEWRRESMRSPPSTHWSAGRRPEEYGG